MNKWQQKWTRSNNFNNLNVGRGEIWRWKGRGMEFFLPQYRKYRKGSWRSVEQKKWVKENLATFKVLKTIKALPLEIRTPIHSKKSVKKRRYMRTLHPQKRTKNYCNKLKENKKILFLKFPKHTKIWFRFVSPNVSQTFSSVCFPSSSRINSIHHWSHTHYSPQPYSVVYQCKFHLDTNKRVQEGR